MRRTSADNDTDLSLSIRRRRDEIDKRVFALFLDHWRNIPNSLSSAS